MTEFTQERIAHDRNLANMASCLKWITETGKYSGSNWLVFSMDFGTGHDDKNRYIYVTTDHVHGTEYSGAEDDVAYVMAAVNGYPDALDEIDTLRARIAELEEANRWIPVSERLPEDKQDVFALTQNGDFKAPRFLNDGDTPCWRRSDSSYCDELKHFTHWRPLPSAPEADK